MRPDGEVEDVEGLSPVVPGSGWEEGELHEPTQSLGGNNQGRMTKARVLLPPVSFRCEIFLKEKIAPWVNIFFVPVAKKFGVMMPFSLFGNGCEIALHPRLV